MLKKEDIDSWNKLFPQCEIRPNDLTNPTEIFLTKALVVYLRKFGYKVEPPFALGEFKENKKENRAFLIKLARQTDEILKITDHSYTFTYVDLINPSPKKTSIFLRILLNYLFFYNMFREEIYVMANDRIQQMEDLKMRIETAKKENESRRKEAATMQKTTETLSAELPAVEEELAAFKEQQTAAVEKTNNLKAEVEELKTKFAELQEQKRTLNKSYVSDEETGQLKKQLQDLHKNLQVLKKREAKFEKDLNEHKANIAKLQKNKKDTERAINIFPISLIEDFKESKKQLEAVHQMHLQSETKHENLTKAIDELSEKFKEFQLQYNTTKSTSEEKHKQQQKEIEILEKYLAEKNHELDQLIRRESELQKQLDEQREIRQYLKDNFDELLFK